MFSTLKNSKGVRPKGMVGRKAGEDCGSDRDTVALGIQEMLVGLNLLNQ